jgi:hypothetical protein
VREAGRMLLWIGGPEGARGREYTNAPEASGTHLGGRAPGLSQFAGNA